MTVLARDTFTGGDTANLEGRTPDGGSPSTPGLAVGTWRQRWPWGSLAISGGLLVEGEDGTQSAYALEGVPGLDAVAGDHGVRVVGRFPRADVSYDEIIAILRAHGTLADGRSGYEFGVYSDGSWELYRIVAGDWQFVLWGWLDAVPTAFAPGATVEIVGCARGPVLRWWVNGTLALCLVDGQLTGGAPGVGVFDGSDSARGVEVTLVEATTGCADDVGGTDQAGVTAESRLTMRDACQVDVWARLAPRRVRGLWRMVNGAFRPVTAPTSCGGTGPGDCGHLPGAPLYSLVLPPYTDYAYAPDGADAAAVQTTLPPINDPPPDTPAGTQVTRAALYPGARMAAADMDTYAGNYLAGNYGMYTPGRLAGTDGLAPYGVNKLHDTRFATVEGIPTPAAVYGVTAPPRWWTVAHGTVDLGCLGTLDDVHLIWRDPAMTGATQTLEHAAPHVWVGGAAGVGPGGVPIWAYRIQEQPCSGSGSLPTTGVDFRPPATPDAAAPSGPNGHPGQLPRTGMSGGAGGTVVPDAKYLANVLQIRTVDEATGPGGALERHVRYRYGVIYSVPEGCGVERLDWTDYIERTFDLTDCVPATGDTDASTLTVADVDYWQGQHEIYATAAESGDVYVLDPDTRTHLRTIATTLPYGRGLAYNSA
ncbi:MAG TPA: hypothetical protein VFS08_09955, partial [Gemmatimonadaceae bacterium]|nr:hypothetical protein [Gemmatimonadaceae bacterium]